MREMIRCVLTVCSCCFCGASAGGQEMLEMTTVVPKQSDEVLFNPGMGLYMSGGERTRIKGDEWFTSVVNIMYIRTDWARLQPEEDELLFDDFFGPLFEEWVDKRHARLAFRFMSENVSSSRKYVTPKWVFDKGVPHVNHRGKRSEVQIDPVFWDGRYLRECERFIERLGRYLDGREGFEFIDIGCIGEWGEMHLGLHIPGRWTPEQLQETGFTRTRYVGAYRRVIDAFARAFPDGRVFLNVGDEWAINDYAALRGVHFRQDGLKPSGPSANVGKRFYLPYQARGILGNYEFHSSYDGMKAKGWNLRATVEKGLEDRISYLNTNVFWMPRLTRAPESAREILTDAARRIGYRFVPTEVTLPRRLRLDGEHPGRLPITHVWRNAGVAPCTESFAFEFSLVDSRQSQNRTVARELFFPRVPTTRWSPGEDVSERALLRVGADTRPGSYTLKVAVLCPERDRKIMLGIAGRDADGRYDLCTIEGVRVPVHARQAFETGFEAGSALWKAAAGVEVLRDEDVRHAGRASMKVQGTQQGGWNFASFELPRPIMPGARYRLSCWMRVDELEPRRRRPYLKIELRDREGRFLGNLVTGRYDPASVGTWQRLSLEFDTPIDAAAGVLAIEKGQRDLAVKVKLWLDEVSLELLESP